jgi:hypothetical protein
VQGVEGRRGRYRAVDGVGGSRADGGGSCSGSGAEEEGAGGAAGVRGGVGGGEWVHGVQDRLLRLLLR